MPQVMGRNGRQRRMGALLTVVTAMFAVLLMMAGMTTPALAAEQHAAKEALKLLGVIKEK